MPAQLLALGRRVNATARVGGSRAGNPRFEPGASAASDARRLPSCGGPGGICPRSAPGQSNMSGQSCGSAPGERVAGSAAAAPESTPGRASCDILRQSAPRVGAVPAPPLMECALPVPSTLDDGESADGAAGRQSMAHHSARAIPRSRHLTAQQDRPLAGTRTPPRSESATPGLV